MTREEAHRILTALRAGVHFPMQTINAALVATGDLARWMPREAA